MTTTKLIELIRGAKESVVIQTPYLVISELGLSLFAEAEARGVEVTIMTNSLASTDNLMAFNGYLRNRDDLLRAGVDLYEFRPDAAVRRKIMTSARTRETGYFPIFGLHAKTLIVDRKTLVVATFNLDPRSANLNTECYVSIQSAEMVARTLGYIEEEMKSENAWRTTLDWNPNSEGGWGKRFMLIWHGILPKSVL